MRSVPHRLILKNDPPSGPLVFIGQNCVEKDRWQVFQNLNKGFNSCNCVVKLTKYAIGRRLKILSVKLADRIKSTFGVFFTWSKFSKQ